MGTLLRVPDLLGRSSPTWVHCYRYLIYCGGHAVKVASVLSGSCLHDLRGHTGRVTSLLLNPQNQFQVFSSSLDGHIIKWDFRDGVRLQTLTLGSPLTALYSIGDSFVAVQRKASRTLAVMFRMGKVVEKTRVIMDTVSDRQRHLACGCQDDVVGAVCGRTLHVYSVSTDKLKSYKLESLHIQVDRSVDKKLNTAMTCVACHPTEQCIATGVVTGVIVLWYQVGRHAQPKRSLRKWHVLPVQDLCFTASGSYLLSGGQECVLLKWTMGSDVHDTKPRMGAPICSISVSPDGTKYASCHTDNAIQVMSNAFLLVQHFQGLASAFLKQGGRTMPAGLTYDPRTGALVTNGRPGHLQFYSVEHDMHLFSLDIVGQNYVSSVRPEEPLIVTEIENVTFTDDAQWLATVERRDDGVTSPEMKLKFWHYNSEEQIFELNTSVDQPHTLPSHSLRFRPRRAGATDSYMAVTTSADGKFRLWTSRYDTDVFRDNVCWSCESQGYYRSLACGACDFAQDGSLLAVAFRTTLTLWEPDSNSLRHSLPLGRDIRFLHFAGGSCGHYILLATDTSICSLNLLSCTVEWSVPWCVTAMAPCPRTHYTVVFTAQQQLHVMNARSAAPVYSRSQTFAAPVRAAVFIPDQEGAMARDECPPWLRQHALYFINSQQEVLTLGLANTSPTSQESVVLSQQLPATPFSIILNKNRKVDAPHVTRDVIGEKIAQPGSSFVQEMLLTPAHVLPPVSSLCMAFHENLLLPKKHRERNKDEREASEEESSEDDASGQSDMDTDDDVIEPNHEDTGSKEATSVGQGGHVQGGHEAGDCARKPESPSAEKLNYKTDSREQCYEKLSKHTFKWLQVKSHDQDT